MRSVTELFRERAVLFESVGKDAGFCNALSLFAKMITAALRRGNKIIIFGNGGSFAQSQHFAAELVGKYRTDRPALSAVSVPANMAAFSAYANDVGFDRAIAREVEAYCVKGDVAIGLTTSDADLDTGHSANLYHAFAAARKKGATTLCLGSEKTEKLRKTADGGIFVPNSDTPLVQEVHQTVIHILCELIESALTKKKK